MQPGEVAGVVVERLEPRPVAGLEADSLAQGIGHHENVAEQDGGVEAEPADRLQRRLGGQAGVVAEIEEARGGRADLAIFGQVAPGLAHQPDRRRTFERSPSSVAETVWRTVTSAASTGDAPKKESLRFIF